MTKSELKRRMKQQPHRYKECLIVNGIQEKQYVTVNGDDEAGERQVGIVVMLNYPEPGKCIIDTDIDQRILEGNVVMDNSLMVFLSNLLFKGVGRVWFEPIVMANDKEKKEWVKIELPDLDLTFIGSGLADVVKKTAQFFDRLPQISERIIKEGELRTSAKKILLDGAKNVD